MKIKKILCFALVACMLPCIVVPLTACEQKKMYTSLEKLADHLYKIDYKDYRVDTDYETITWAVDDFGCSAVKNGNFYGRNYDYYYDESASYLVEMKASNERFASIGIAKHKGLKDSQLQEWAKGKKYQPDLELIPNYTVDGINENGVVCNVNVVSYDDAEKVTGTNPGAERLNLSFACRFILDNATSAENAIELLQARDLFLLDNADFNIHFMIADINKTFVVEFIDNKMVAKEKTGDAQIMTNFYVNTNEYLNDGTYNEHAIGVERYYTLQQNYDMGSTFDGMFELMQLVKYSHTYASYFYAVWPSEFLTQSQIKAMDNGENVSIVELKQKYGITDPLIPDEITPERVLEIYQQYLYPNYWNVYGKQKRELGKSEDVWITIHNSIYDIENKKIRITVQENYTQYFEFSLKN